MYRRAFPPCEVKGSVEPVPFNHLGFRGSIPKKCAGCRFQLEGECTRAMEQTQRSLALDHGPCPFDGDTRPTTVLTEHFQSTVAVPTKCRRCRFLEVSVLRGFLCGFEAERWGWYRRSLDWGGWLPELPNVGLASGRPVSADLLRPVMAGDEAGTITVFREQFPDSTFAEARQAFAELRAQLGRLPK